MIPELSGGYSRLFYIPRRFVVWMIGAPSPGGRVRLESIVEKLWISLFQIFNNCHVVAGHGFRLKIQLKASGVNRQRIRQVPNLQRNRLPILFVGSRQYILNSMTNAVMPVAPCYRTRLFSVVPVD